MNPVEEIAGLIQEAGGAHVVLDETLSARAMRHFRLQEFYKQPPHEAGTWLVRPAGTLFHAGRTVALRVRVGDGEDLYARIKIGRVEMWASTTAPQLRDAEWFGPLEDLRPAE